MKKRGVIRGSVVLFFLLVLIPSIAYCQNSLPAVFKQVSPSVVVIYTFDKSGKPISQGSGFFINGKGDVITNRHVIQGAYSAQIKTIGEKTYTVDKMLADDSLGDLVRLSTSTPPGEVRPVILSKKVPETGEQIVVIGSPKGLEYSISDGIVSAVRNISGIGAVLQITAPISPGSSGSPVLNMQGEVVGVATSQVVEGQNLNFAMPCERITKLAATQASSTPAQPKTALDNESTTADDFLKKGLGLLFSGENKKALPYLKKAAEDQPGSADIFFYLGLCLGNLDQPREAVDAFKEALRIKPDFAEAHNNLGVAYGRLGQNQDAVQSLKQAIRIKPDWAEAHYNLGISYGKLRQYRDATQAYKEALRIKPNWAEAHYTLGLAYCTLGQYREAIKAYKQAIRIKPDWAEAHCDLGGAYFMLDQYREAIEAFKQAIRLKPDYAEAHDFLGTAYVFIKENGAALDEYKILKNLDSQRANKLFNLIYK